MLRWLCRVLSFPQSPERHWLTSAVKELRAEIDLTCDVRSLRPLGCLSDAPPTSGVQKDSFKAANSSSQPRFVVALTSGGSVNGAGALSGALDGIAVGEASDCEASPDLASFARIF